jgi:hypothetical protein
VRWSDLRSGAAWAVIALLAYAFAGSALVGQLMGRPLSPLTAFLEGGRGCSVPEVLVTCCR